MALPKWTDERTSKLEELVAGESPVTQETVASISEELETTKRSVSSKLRKMGYEVELASTTSVKTFSDAQASALAHFVETNSGDYTYAEIAERFEAGKFSAKQIQGKVLSMELTEHVKPTPKPETVKTYTSEEEATFLDMVSNGAYLEDIAAELGKALNSVRGKALSFLRSGDIDAIPKQKESAAKAKVDPLDELGDAVADMTVAELAEELDKTPRGVRTMLTRRGLVAKDYDGAAKKAKAADSAE
jgi:hypothetical protein